MNKKLAYGAVGIVVGVFVTITVQGLVRIDWFQWEPFSFFWNLTQWRIARFIKPFFGVVATIYVLKGRLKAAISMMLGYFLIEAIGGALEAITYWP